MYVNHYPVSYLEAAGSCLLVILPLVCTFSESPGHSWWKLMTATESTALSSLQSLEVEVGLGVGMLFW